MRLFQAALDTPLDSPLVHHPLSSRFALHGLRALEFTGVMQAFRPEWPCKRSLDSPEDPLALLEKGGLLGSIFVVKTRVPLPLVDFS